MKCIHCGADIEENKEVCEYCGKSQNSVSESNAVENIQEQQSYGKMPTYNGSVAYGEINNVKNKAIFILLLISLAACIGACFLPYFNIEGYTFNYVYTDLLGNVDIKDGIFIVVLSALSIIFLITKKRIPILIFQLLGLFVFVFDFIHDSNEIGDLSNYYSIGFYLVFVFLVISVVLSLIRVIMKKKMY